MARVRVWNDNVLDHTETFKGDRIHIPKKSFIEMDQDEAVQFKSNFFPPRKHSNGLQTDDSKKIIRLELIEGATAAPEPEKHQCMKCGQVCATKAALSQHVKHKHLEALEIGRAHV